MFCTDFIQTIFTIQYEQKIQSDIWTEKKSLQNPNVSLACLDIMAAIKSDSLDNFKTDIWVLEDTSMQFIIDNKRIFVSPLHIYVFISGKTYLLPKCWFIVQFILESCYNWSHCQALQTNCWLHWRIYYLDCLSLAPSLDISAQCVLKNWRRSAWHIVTYEIISKVAVHEKLLPPCYINVYE